MNYIIIYMLINTLMIKHNCNHFCDAMMLDMMQSSFAH